MAGLPRIGRRAVPGGRRGKGPLSAILIFGTGAMASLFGARLARAGNEVTLAGAWREAIEALGRGGVRVEEAGGTWSAPVGAAFLDGPLPGADLVLVLVKSYRTAEIAPFVARASSAGTLLTLQNGLGNREALEAAGAPSVLVGVTTAGATLLGPGRVRGHVSRTILGDDGAGRAQEAAAVFRNAGLETEVAPNIEAVLWRKLVAYSAINALTAILDVENGALLKNAAWRARLEAAAQETAGVARAKGIELGEDPVALVVLVATATAGNRSSMLQDLARGSRTEIDAINGAVVREGRRLGVPTPENEALWSAVREREAGLSRKESA